MLTKLLHNFWLKIAAIGLGLVVWLHVATEKSYNYELHLPITEVALGDSLTLADNPPDSLFVSVVGSGKQLLRQRWREGGVRINAVGYGPGRQEVTVSTDNASLLDPSGQVSLDEVISPTRIVLDVDERTEAEVPVAGAFVAKADDGFAVRHPIKIDPPIAVLSGPQTIIRQIRAVNTESRQLDGLRTDISIKMALALPDLYGLTVTPESVLVTLEVVPVKTRVFDGIPVRLINAPNDTLVVTLPMRIRVELSGPPGDIDELSPTVLTASADYREMRRNGWAPLQIDCPPAFSIKATTADSVKVIYQDNADSRN